MAYEAELVFSTPDALDQYAKSKRIRPGQTVELTDLQFAELVLALDVIECKP